MPDDVLSDELQTAGSIGSKYHRNHAPYTARIKKMMQADEDVGKVAKASPILISKALDEFLHALLDGAAAVAQQRGAKTLSSSHLKAHITAHPLLDFCLEAVKSVPDLPPFDASIAATKPPKKRTKASTDDGNPKGRRGRKKAADQPVTEQAELASSAEIVNGEMSAPEVPASEVKAEPTDDGQAPAGESPDAEPDGAEDDVGLPSATEETPNGEPDTATAAYLVEEEDDYDED